MECDHRTTPLFPPAVILGDFTLMQRQRCNPKARPRSSAHRDAASVDRILGRELARGFRFGRDVALDSLLREKEEIEKWAAVGSA